MNLNSINLIIVGLFLIFEILTIIKIIRSKTYSDFFWFCDFAPLLLAIGFFFEYEQFIKSLVNIGLLTQLFTLSLLLFGFISKKDVIGTKNARAHGKFYIFVEIMIHILPISLAFLLTYKISPDFSSLFYSFIIIIFMFILTLTFTSPKDNVNLVYNLRLSYERDSWKFNLPYYKYLWIIYTFIIVIIPTFLIQYLLYIIL